MNTTEPDLPAPKGTPMTPVRCVAAVRLRTDQKTDHALVALDSATVDHLVGGPARMVETDFLTALVTSTDESQQLNEHAMEIADLYGIPGPLYGDVLLFGYDGERLLDAPGAAIMLGMEYPAAA